MFLSFISHRSKFSIHISLLIDLLQYKKHRQYPKWYEYYSKQPRHDKSNHHYPIYDTSFTFFLRSSHHKSADNIIKLLSKKSLWFRYCFSLTTYLPFIMSVNCLNGHISGDHTRYLCDCRKLYYYQQCPILYSANSSVICTGCLIDEQDHLWKYPFKER